MVAEDGGLVVPEGVGDPLPLLEVEHHPGVVVEDGVVLVEGAHVLGDGVEQPGQRRPRLAVDRVGVGGGDHVGAGGVDLRVDDEGGGVDRHVALDHLPLVVDQDEVGDPDVAEVHGEGVHPEVVGALGVAGGDVPGHPLVEAELGEEAEAGRQPLLAVQAVLLGRVELATGGPLDDLGHGSSSTAGRSDGPPGQGTV